MLISWVLILNYLAFSSVNKPSTLGKLARTMARIGYVNIAWQVLGCILLVSLECVIVFSGLEDIYSPLGRVGIGVVALLGLIILEFRVNLPQIVRNKFLKLNPSKWEVVEYVVFSWNLFLYSAAITVAAFGTDLLSGLGPDVFSGWQSEITSFFCLAGSGAFGGKVIELLKGNVGT